MTKENVPQTVLQDLQGGEMADKNAIKPAAPAHARTAPKGAGRTGREQARGFFQRLIDPLTGIAAVIHELSPKGLAERGVPFTSALKMPQSVLIASIIINIAGLALPLVILQVYDRVIPNEANETFALMMLGLGSVVIVEGLLRIARSYVVSWAAMRFTKAITQDLVSRFLYASKVSFVGISQAKMIEKLSNINRVAEFTAVNRV